MMFNNVKATLIPSPHEITPRREAYHNASPGFTGRLSSCSLARKGVQNTRCRS